MTIPASEREVHESLATLRKFLSKIALGSPDSSTAERSLRLLNRYDHIAINEDYCMSLGADLTRGISEWGWSEAAWATIDPLLDDLSNKAMKHIDLLRLAPNNSFKPNPLRGSA